MGNKASTTTTSGRNTTQQQQHQGSSSSSSCWLLHEIPKVDVVKYVESLGAGNVNNEYDFRCYAKLVDDNGIDGDLLSEMNEQVFLETLDDIDVVDKHHRQILLKEFQKFTTTTSTSGDENNGDGDVDDNDESDGGGSSATDSDGEEEEEDDSDESDSDDSSASGSSSSSDDDDGNTTDEGEDHVVKKYQPTKRVINNNPQRQPQRQPQQLKQQPQQQPQDYHKRHLSSNFYQAVDSVVVDPAKEDDVSSSSSSCRPSSPQANSYQHHPPISVSDIDRVAQLETYKLEEIPPGSPIAAKLESLVKMAMNLFDPLCDMGDITWLNHQYQYSLARVYAASNSNSEDDTQPTIENQYEIMNYHPNTGKPYLCRTDRSIGICNYPTYTGKTLVLHDILQDPAFSWMRHVWPHRCYIGAPLLTASGVVIGTLCLHNLEPLSSKDDFDRQCEIQLEQVANMIMQSIENWKLRRNISVLETTRISLTQNGTASAVNKSKPPTDGKAVICFVGVEEYETLMDVAPKPMKTALKIYHDQISQLCTKYHGYKVNKAGPYYNNNKNNNGSGSDVDGGRHCLIFHDAVDAFGFSLQLQQSLFDADWSIDVLALPRVGDNGQGFRGLRVKCSIYMGPINKVVVPPNNKQQVLLEYESKVGNQNTIGIANTLYEMCYGGQILTIFDTWNVASFLAESTLESPQVVDLGEHIIKTGLKVNEGVLQQRIVQLVPAPLAIDYGEVKGVATTSAHKDQLLQDFSVYSTDIDQSMRQRNHQMLQDYSVYSTDIDQSTINESTIDPGGGDHRRGGGGNDSVVASSATSRAVASSTTKHPAAGRRRSSIATRRASNLATAPEEGTSPYGTSSMMTDQSMDMSIADDLALCSVMQGGLWGRQFPEINSEKKLSPSFFDAPGFNDDTGQPTVTIAFIGTGELEKTHKDATEIVSRIIGLAASALQGTRGYQCQNNMLAFPNITSAIDFGLNFSLLLQKQQQKEQDEVNLGNLITYGCVHDSFVTLEPHKTTGRADYFGKVVNRAARVAYSSALGTVSAGVVVTPECDENSFTVAGDPTITTRFVDRRRLKGVEGEVAVYECSRMPT